MHASTSPPFVHLRVHTAHSLSEGALRLKDLFNYAQAHRTPAIAVTDRANLFAALEFSVKAREAGVQPICGSLLQLVHGQHKAWQLLLVQNRQGYENLMQLVSETYLRQEGHEQHGALPAERVLELNAGLLAFVGAPDSYLAQRLDQGDTESAVAHLTLMRQAFGDRLLVELQRHGRAETQAREERLLNLAYDHQLPLVATNDAHFRARTDFEAQDVLASIAQGKTLNHTDRESLTPEHSLKAPEDMAAIFADLPEAVLNTAYVAERCAYAPERHAPILPHFESTRGLSEPEELAEQARSGLEARLERYVYEADMSTEARALAAQPYRDRLERELSVITEMGFPGYFLIVADFIGWAKRQRIPVGPGRGSGAGSLVAYALQITDLDPLRWGLLFERFLHNERVSMPDFDIDFCQDRRDEVITYVQEKYGVDRVAAIITFGSLKARAALRDVGRVLSMPYGQVDRICKLVPNNPANPVALEQAIKEEPALQAAQHEDPQVGQLFSIALKLEGLYRHASTHAAGIVIGDRPLHELVALYQDPRSHLPATQFDMKWVEEAGLVKFDFLGLKTLTVLQQAQEIAERYGAQIDLGNLPLEDPAVYEMLCRGDTAGVFQMEGQGMRDTIMAVQPDSLNDLIALVSLYRPGPMDNIPLFTERKHGKRALDYMHPKLEPVLKETYGIMVYQEQVMQAAQVLAGYELSAADMLRRAMGKKKVDEMRRQRAAFVAGCAEHSNIGEQQALKIFEQIQAFAGYGFNKSHAAAYALVAFQTAWMKVHHPLAFMVANMNLDRGSTNRLAFLREELNRQGIELLPPDVQHSYAHFVPEGEAVRYGLAALKGAGEALMEALAKVREEGGPFESLTDFLKRCAHLGLNKRQLEVLIRSGALDSLHANRAQLIKNLEALGRYAQHFVTEDRSGMDSLFSDSAMPKEIPLHLEEAKAWELDQQLEEEKATVGFYLSEHPLSVFWPELEALGHRTFAQAQEMRGGTVRLAGLVTSMKVRKSAKGNRYAFLSLSDPSAAYEVTLFSELLEKHRAKLEAGNQVSLEVSMREDESQGLRLTAQSLSVMDEVLKNKTHSLLVECREAEQVEALATLLKELSPGRSTVKLRLALEQEAWAEVDLPQRLAVGREAQSALRKVPGLSFSLASA